MKIDFRSCEDWVVMYIDNLKVLEGHSLKIKEVLDALGIRATYADIREPPGYNAGWDYDMRFGDTIDDIEIIWYNDIEDTYER